MRKFKFPIWAFMLALVFVALGCGALRQANEIWAGSVFSLVVTLLCVALILMATATGRKRIASLAFAVTGWAYLGFTFGPMPSSRLVNPPPLIFSTLVAKGLSYLETNLPSTPAVSGNSNPSPVTFRYYTVAKQVQTVGYRTTVISPNVEPLRQIGHSVATLVFSLLAAVVTLIIPIAKRNDTKALDSLADPSQMD